MTWHALHYPLKPGSEDVVAELFRSSGRPQFDVKDGSGGTVGRLLGTMAFVGKGKALRVIEVEGELGQVAAHMSRQPEVRAFEDELEEHLAVPRDMRSPEGARAFFQEAAMGSVAVAVGQQGEASQWAGVYYPIKPGHEPAVRDLVGANGRPELIMRDESGSAVGRVNGMMFFLGKEKALRLVKITGTKSEFRMHMSRQPAAREFQQRLDEHLAVDRTAPSGGGPAQFFSEAWVDCVLSRRHDQEI